MISYYVTKSGLCVSLKSEMVKFSNYNFNWKGTLKVLRSFIKQHMKPKKLDFAGYKISFLKRLHNFCIRGHTEHGMTNLWFNPHLSWVVKIIKSYEFQRCPLFYILFFLIARLLETSASHMAWWPLSNPTLFMWIGATAYACFNMNLQSVFDNTLSHFWRVHNWNAASDMTGQRQAY